MSGSRRFWMHRYMEGGEMNMLAISLCLWSHFSSLICTISSFTSIFLLSATQRHISLFAFLFAALFPNSPDVFLSIAWISLRPLERGHFECFHSVSSQDIHVRCVLLVPVFRWATIPKLRRPEKKKQKHVAKYYADTSADLPGMTHPTLSLIGLPWYSYTNLALV